jgi:hypothetical protein
MLEMIVDFVLHFWPLRPRWVFAIFAGLLVAIWVGLWLAGIDPSGPTPRRFWNG